MTTPSHPAPLGPAGRFAQAWIDSKLTPLIILGSILLGIFAVIKLPREEEPQIIVPMVDIFVAFPGATPAEVEQRVTRPMEKLLWQVPGVEYLYSTSSPGMATVIGTAIFTAPSRRHPASRSGRRIRPRCHRGAAQ